MKAMPLRRGWQAGRFQTRSASIAGFTLVETVVSFAILGIVFIGLFSGMAWGFTMVQWTRENARATQIMLDKMEQYRLFSWEQIITNGLPTTFVASYYESPQAAERGFTYTGNVSISDAPLSESYISQMRCVTVRVSWTSGKLSHTREISTLVAATGLQRHLY